MEYFSPSSSTASDEIDAHVSMFDPNYNPSYFELGNLTLQKLDEMLERPRKSSWSQEEERWLF